MLKPWVLWSVSLPNCSSQIMGTLMWDHPVSQPQPHPHGSPPCHLSCLSWLPNSSPPTSLDECSFNSLVVRLPCSFIFGQFWLFIVFKLVVMLFLVVRGSETFLLMPPSWLELYLCAILRGVEMVLGPPLFFFPELKCVNKTEKILLL